MNDQEPQPPGSHADGAPEERPRSTPSPLLDWHQFYGVVFEDDHISDWFYTGETSRAAINRIIRNGRSSPLDTRDAETLLGILALPLLEGGGTFEGRSLYGRGQASATVSTEEVVGALRLVLESELAELFSGAEDWRRAVRTVADHYGAEFPADAKPKPRDNGVEMVLPLGLPQWKAYNFTVTDEGDIRRGPIGVSWDAYKEQSEIHLKAAFEPVEGYGYWVNDDGNVVRVRQVELK